MKTAYMFPGQGSQAIGMGKELYDASPIAREVFDKVEAALGGGLLDLIWGGTMEELSQAKNSQPAIFAVSMAMWTERGGLNAAGDAVIFGHSLGEYSALCAAGAIGITDAAQLLRRRGELMQSAVPAGVGAMAAVIGIGWTMDDVAAICAEASVGGKVASVANDNGIGQVVISGACEAVEKVVEIALTKEGVKLAKVLPISVPAHSAMMEPMVAEFRAAVEAITWTVPKLPFISNKTADVMSDVAEITEALIFQLTHGVRFQECVLRAQGLGMSDFVEIGPGNLLSAIVRRIIA